jgi:peptide/nickel transport system permease protein
VNVRNFPLWCGLFLTLLLIVGALLAPWLMVQDPTAQNLALQFAGPTWKHPLGNGVNGVDLLSQLLWGARISITVGFTSVITAAAAGMLLGSIAGHFRGWTERIIMRFVDMVHAFPGVLLVVALASVLGPGIQNMILVLTFSSWANYARVAHSLSIGLREQEFMLAARAQGASDARLIVKHLWPNLLPFVLVQMSFGLGVAITTESTLSFLGIGAPPESVSWGQMINQGRELLLTSPRLVIVPGIALVLAVLGLNLLGDGLRDFLDPKKIEIRGT